VVERGAAEEVPDFDDFWNDFETFESCQHAHGMDEEEVLSPREAEMLYDIARWRLEGMPKNVAPYRLPQPEPFHFQLTEEGARELAAAFKVWTFTLRGLTKMVTRIQMAWQVRSCVRVMEGESPSLSVV